MPRCGRSTPPPPFSPPLSPEDDAKKAKAAAKAAKAKRKGKSAAEVSLLKDGRPPAASALEAPAAGGAAAGAPLLASPAPAHAVLDDPMREIPPVLKGLNLEVPAGQLWAVIGRCARGGRGGNWLLRRRVTSPSCRRVGSGKTALCGAILGELSKANGSVTVNGRCAYVSQVGGGWVGGHFG